jgi:hypothetical protein
VVDRLDASLSRGVAAHVADFRDLSDQDVDRLAVGAIDYLVSAARWSRAVGDRWSTEQVCRLLGVTRQALMNRRKAGSLVALEGSGTSWYPAWQFAGTDVGRAEVRPVVLRVVGAFREALGERATSFIVASWASSPHHELGMSPAEWIGAGLADEDVVVSARRDAWAEAR